MIALVTDIRRSRSSGALPWGASQADQDALYWEAEDVVSSAQAEVFERLKPAKPEGGNGG